MGVLDRFKKKPDEKERGRVQVSLNPETGAFHAEVLSPILAHEVAAALEHTLRAMVPITERRRRALVDSWIREKTKENKLVDKLAGRASRWEAAARARLPLEHFTGRAAGGFVEVTVDGTLAFRSLEVHPGAQPESAFALAADALRDAERACEARYHEVLAGGLDDDGPAGSEAGES